MKLVEVHERVLKERLIGNDPGRPSMDVLLRNCWNHVVLLHVQLVKLHFVAQFLQLSLKFRRRT